MSYEEAFAPAIAYYKSLVIHSTWGHLFPNQIYYEGTIRLACPLYGAGMVIIDESESLPGSSPWWFDAVHGFANDIGANMEPGQVLEIAISASIIQCEEELEDWQIDEEQEPDTWTEIHIAQLKKTILLETTNES